MKKGLLLSAFVLSFLSVLCESEEVRAQTALDIMKKADEVIYTKSTRSERTGWVQEWDLRQALRACPVRLGVSAPLRPC